MENPIYKETRLATGISVPDLRRALLNGGDISLLAPVLGRVLKKPSAEIVSSFETPLLLPDTDALLLDKETRLAELTESWRRGEERTLASPVNVELIMLPLPPLGRNVADYLKRTIEKIGPDIVALDAAPDELAASMLYTFSLPAAIGVTVYADIRVKDENKPYGSRAFYPGGRDETAILTAWLQHIPLVPVGRPYAPGHAALSIADEDVVDEEMSGLQIKESYEKTDELLAGNPYLSPFLEGATQRGQALENSVSIHINHKLVREAKYSSSRILELASFVSNKGEKIRLLAVMDSKHYPGVRRHLELMLSGVVEDNYRRPEEATHQALHILGRHAMTSSAAEPLPQKSPLTHFFETALNEWSEGRRREILEEQTVDRYIAIIMERLRTHPLVRKGASVRGSLGVKEVVQSLSHLNGGDFSRESLEKAAIITLPARLGLKPGVKETKESIVGDTVKEALYGIDFYRTVYTIGSGGSAAWLAPEEINRLLESLSKEKKPGEGIPDKSDEAALLKALAARQFIRRSLEGGFVLTSKSIQRLIRDLQQRRQEGKLTPDAYDLEKKRLEEMLEAARESEYEISQRELAGMVLDFMDVVDKRFEKEWGRDINYLRLFLYYRMKYEDGNSISSWQQDWTELKHRLDTLERRGIIKIPAQGGERVLSGLGLASLLQYLEPRNEELKRLHRSITATKSLVSQRSEEIRHFTSANTYRDISFRHTLKEVARQKKEINGVRRSDFRVYVKPQRKQHTDIVLCLDTSGSMAEHHKLVYARLAGAAITSAAKESEDRAAVVSFEDSGRTSIPLSDESNGQVNDYLAGLTAVGATNIGDGIKCAVDLLTREPNHNKRRIYLITDGEPNAISEKALTRLKEGSKSGDLTEEAAIVETRRAAARGITLSVIYTAAEKMKGYDFVKGLARAGKGEVIMIDCNDDEPILKEYSPKYVDFQEYR